MSSRSELLRASRSSACRFISGRANYYELGGMNRRLHWKIWCQQVRRLLASKVNGSSLSETTAASSPSSSALYLLSSEIEVADNCDARCAKPVYRCELIPVSFKLSTDSTIRLTTSIRVRIFLIYVDSMIFLRANPQTQRDSETSRVTSRI